eukprot:scaffold17477_cov103-Isochrysis_galbana.AAC.1
MASAASAHPPTHPSTLPLSPAPPQPPFPVTPQASPPLPPLLPLSPHSLFGGAAEEHTLMDYDTVPTVVFSHPPLAVCGLTEVGPATCPRNSAHRRAAAANLYILNSPPPSHFSR